MTIAKPVPVETGLWTLYVDNCPMGQSLRHHPTDNPDVRVMSRDNPDEPVGYETLQKVYCDRKVTNPQTQVCFYRVQAVNQWLMDRRIVRNDATGDTTITQMLVDALHIRTGVFCFEALENLLVRSKSTVSDDAGTSYKIRKGSLVSVDAIQETSSDPGNGPFLRLSDGSGWLFTHKNGVPMMKQVHVQPGLWELQVLPTSEGLTMQTNPGVVNSEKDPSPNPPFFAPNTMLQADYRIRIMHPSCTNEKKSIIYYRIQGTQGWIPDHQADTSCLTIMTEDLDTMASLNPTPKSGWSPDFVRGVACTIGHLQETEFFDSPSNPVLVFRSISAPSPRACAGRTSLDNSDGNGIPDGIRKVVYCGTRTVGILYDDQKIWYRTCEDMELYDHLRKDAVEILSIQNSGSDPSNNSQTADLDTSSQGDAEMDRVALEEKLRAELLALDKEIESAEAKRISLARQVFSFDQVRIGAAQAMREMTEKRRKAFEALSSDEEERRDDAEQRDEPENTDTDATNLVDVTSTESTASTLITELQPKSTKSSRRKLLGKKSSDTRSRDRSKYSGQSKHNNNNGSQGGRMSLSERFGSPRSRGRATSAERESFRNRIDQLLKLRSHENEFLDEDNEGRTGIVRSMPSPEAGDISFEEEPNSTLFSGSYEDDDDEDDDGSTTSSGTSAEYSY